MKRRWTLQIVPGDGERPRSFRVDRRAVLCAAVAGILAASSAAAGFVLFGTGLVRAERLSELRAENRDLRAGLERAERRTDRLAGALDRLDEREKRFRLLAGLPMLDPEVREVGVGGPATTPDATGASAVAAELDRLERRTELLASSISEAADSLRVRRAVFRARPSILPVAGEEAWISASFSHSRRHPILHHSQPHEGIDISARAGAPILATATGRVSFTGWVPGYGKMVELDHGYGHRTRYAHASRILVREGIRVERGDVIAEVGSTGISTGPHLHYEVLVDGRAVDPRTYFLDDRVVE